MPEPVAIATVVGARPQFIKAAVVIRALENHPVDHTLIHTGQHYDDDMSRVFFDELGIPEPDHDLGVGSGPHGQQTGRMLELIEKVFADIHPDWVLVYGDTNSTLAGALAAAKMHIPIAHVEAGLRSFNRGMPEEVNRVVADHVSDLLFAPTATAVANLRREGLAESRIALVGDVMFDVARQYGAAAEETSRVLERYGLVGEDYALVTVHRAENTDHPERLRTIVTALEALAADLRVVWPLHPRTKLALAELDGPHAGAPFTMLPPASYLDMVMLESHAKLVVTDSGGVQKEAFFHGVPCVTLRDETEWTELVEAGWNRLAPPSWGSTRVSAVLTEALSAGPGRAGAPYGDGTAAAQIAARLSSG